ncbi:MAG TPA: cupin domain-containing protein [Phycisphaerales bacterium]|nr:cupin domain-containing protein [Phycisphaerales bacterium]
MAAVNSGGMGELELVIRNGAGPVGSRALTGLVELAEAAVGRLHELKHRIHATGPAAMLSKIRGTGRGVSFTRLVGELERAHPLTLEYPFEGSDRVGGAVWIARDVVGGNSTTSVAKLCLDSRATDLPMHVHDHSDRFIIVLKGRGYFHVTDEHPEEFTGQQVRSIPARERDVFVFSRGTVHTFSTDAEPMALLSCQLPFMKFDDPRQYRLPRVRWTAKEHPDSYPAGIACDPGWSVLALPRPCHPVRDDGGAAKGGIALHDVLTLGL